MTRGEKELHLTTTQLPIGAGDAERAASDTSWTAVARLRDRGAAARLLRKVEAVLGPAEEYEANAFLPVDGRRALPEPRISTASLRALALELRRSLANLESAAGNAAH